MTAGDLEFSKLAAVIDRRYSDYFYVHRAMTLTKKFVAELVGTAMLLAAIVGSGIMAERLSGGNTAVALLANSIATGAALVAIIVSLGARPGVHINPIVTLSLATRGDMPPGQVACRIAGQFVELFSA